MPGREPLRPPAVDLARLKLERIMKYVLSLTVAAVALGAVSASSNEIEPGISLASLNAVTASASWDGRADSDRNMALVKEGESESPDMIAVIESNREDRERTVVIDR